MKLSEGRAGVIEIPLAARPFEVLAEDLAPEAWARVDAARGRAVGKLHGREVWNINSTALGGGVAEIQRTLLPYWRGSGIDAHWLVMSAPQSFFRLTKGLHEMLHGQGGERRLGQRAARFYETISDEAARAAAARMSPGDLVVLHDPQTAGLAPVLRRSGLIVIWRCHIGADAGGQAVAEAWKFLMPYVREAHRCVFTLREFVPPGLDPERTRVSVPAIDPRSPKNQMLDADTADAILHHCGIATRPGWRRRPRHGARRASLAWGGARLVQRRCSVLRLDRRPRLGEDQLVVALSRWDRLKDPIGIMRAFAEHVAVPQARLIVAGPPPATVTDDPAGAGMLRRVRAAWRRLPRHIQGRIDVTVLPMVDLEENGLIVNALQRRADVVVKKSLQEGFGLGVTEALWKVRPVVATNVGGHRAQIQHGRSGLLIDDPADLAGFGAAITQMLLDRPHALELASVGHQVVRERFLADRHFDDWMDLLGELVDLVQDCGSRGYSHP